MLSLSFPYFFFRVSAMDWGIPEFCWGAVAACGRVGSSILGGGWVDYLVVNGRNYKGELRLYLIQFPSYSTKKDRGAQELGIELPTWTVDVILFSFMLGTGNFSAQLQWKKRTRDGMVEKTRWRIHWRSSLVLASFPGSLASWQKNCGASPDIKEHQGFGNSIHWKLGGCTEVWTSWVASHVRPHGEGGRS